MSWRNITIEKQHLQSRIVYSGARFSDLIHLKLRNDFQITSVETLSELQEFLENQTLFSTPEIIMMEVDRDNQFAVFKMVKIIKDTPLTCGLIIVLISNFHDKLNRKKAIELKVHDYYEHPIDDVEINQRLQFLIKFKLIKSEIKSLAFNVRKKYKMPLEKRVFDVCISSFTLVLLSPVFLIIAMLIRLESKGPIIYKSQRAGTGYKIFDFYKFRSMSLNAEKQLLDLAGSNQYATESEAVFMKIKDDPRVTRIGRFIRKTSIDELPQLFNVLKGDMSIVGNRPLPLYEAELLTSNQWCIRFLGPAGITGLWQIKKRGRSAMSDIERKELDNYYVNHSSLLFDFKIIAMTVPALFQKENV